jgi:hypothetical protein
MRLSIAPAVSAASVLLLLLAARPTFGGQEAGYAELRSARPAGRMLAAESLVLDRDVFRFRFASGVFQFLQPVAGRVVGAVFVGDGSLETRPASEAERRHLAFVTGEKALETLTEPFHNLVLLFTDGTTAEIESRGSPSAGSSAANDAVARSVRAGDSSLPGAQAPTTRWCMPRGRTWSTCSA